MLGKEEPSFCPTSSRTNGPTCPTPGGTQLLSHPTLAHGEESRGSWSLPSCNFQLGFHLVLEDTGLLHAHHVQSVAAQGGDATGAPSSLHRDTEVAPARAWAKEVDALLCSSALPAARIREM